MEITVGAFSASLNAQTGEHGGDEITSIEKSDNGYEMTLLAHSGGKVKILLSAETADSAVYDAVGDEIAAYSMMENIVYITLTADKMMSSKQITVVPLPKLVTDIIQIAEAFDKEYGTEMVGEDTVNALNQFAETKLLELYR